MIAIVGRPTGVASCDPNSTQNAKHYLPIIKQYAHQYQLKVELVQAIIAAESCFDQLAVSKAGAQGLMQLMPATAAELGVSNVFNARQNIAAGTRYLHQMLEMFDADLEFALAAYNAGPGTVQKYQGMPPYPETKNYVRRVLKYFQRFQQSE